MPPLKYFLTRNIYTKDQHPAQHDKYVYDDERIHCFLLQFMCEESAEFSQRMFGVQCLPEKIIVSPEPESGLFDLKIASGNMSLYCEVKVWAKLSENQFERQQEFLRDKHASGVYVLFTKAADDWSEEDICRRSDGRSHRLDIRQVANHVNAVSDFQTEEAREVSNAYLAALNHLAGRW